MKQPDLGKKIAELRKAKGFTQEELVEKCNLSVRTLQRIESGEVTPRSYTIRTIFTALGYDVFDSPVSTYNRFSNAGFIISSWLKQVYQYVFELFNLKENTMKKVSVLSIAILAVGFILFIVCSDGKAQSPVEVKKAIEESNRNYIRWFNAGQIDSLLTLYREDACLVAKGCGQAYIRDYFRSQFNEYKFKQLDIISISVCDSIAVEKGSWFISLNSGGVLDGEYLTEWRFSDKKWLIVNDIGNIN